jgi:carnitine O-acetyltransferase
MTGPSFRKAIAVKPWPKDVYKCDGDYRKEEFLEEHIGGPLYENQKQLPRLPIPSIKETIERFLPTALPLAKTKTEEMALKAACETFPEEAKMLQQRLIDRREKEMKDSSWLQMWWNQLGYLQVRDPVVVNVSYFFSFVDDPTVNSSGTMPNIQRGAAILFAAAQYRKQVIAGHLPAGRVGRENTLLCSTAYKYMFNACRIPQQGQDSYWIYDPSKYTHCIVARKGHFFSAELVDEFGDPLPLAEIEKQLEECIELADAVPSSRPKLGLLTSGNRDNWAYDRVQLLESGGSKMVEALEKLQSGALVLNLDDEAPVSRQECGTLFWTGGLQSGENRWFDKSIQISVCNNGKAGLLAEHSMMDGMPVIGFADFVCKMTYARARHQSQASFNRKGCVVDIFDSALQGVDEKVVRHLETKGKSFPTLQSSITGLFLMT